MSLIIPSNYPLVGFGLASLFAVNMWQSFRVGAARKTADVPYPHMYATVEECKADKKKLVYNCTQRAHQNTLEMSSFIIGMTLFFGLFHPKLGSVFTGLFALGRIGYTTGYSTGNPDNRLAGFAPIQYVGLFGLFFGSVTVAVQHAIALIKA